MIDSKVIDSSGPGIDTPSGNNCVGATAQTSYGTITPAAGDFGGSTDSATAPNFVEYAAKANQDTAYDLVSIQLYKGGSGAFSGGLAPKSGIDLSSAVESQYATCGACALIYTDNTSSGNVDTYLAKSGTMNVTAVSGTHITGDISNVVLTHVTIADDGTFTSTAVGDCDTTITALAFDSDVTVQGGFAGGHTARHASTH